MPLNKTLAATTAAIALALPAAASGYATKTGQGAHLPVFVSPFALAEGDVDGAHDVYVRTPDGPRLLTDGAADDSAQVWHASADGSVGYGTIGGVFAVHTGAEHRKLPVGSGNAQLRGITPDGAMAYVQTAEKLTSADTDTVVDVYEYTTATGAWRLLSLDTPTQDAYFQAANPAGSMVYYDTAEKVTDDDKDSARDTYVTNGTFTLKVSPGDTEGAGVNMHALGSVNHKIVFETAESLVAADTDTKADLYDMTNGAPALLTPSPNAAAAAKPVQFVAASKGSAHRVLFATEEKLVAGDSDTTKDLYATEAGKLTLLTAGVAAYTVEAVSGDAETVLFSTESNMLASDTDQARDMYTNGDAGPKHLLQSDAPYDQFEYSGRLSPDGSVAAFDTNEPALPADADELQDVYTVAGGNVALASGPGDGTAGDPEASWTEYVLSSGEVVFNSAERLLAADRNDIADAYGFKGGELTLISADAFASDTRLAVTDTGAGTFAGTLETDEAGTFECRVDGAEWAACASPWTVGPLAPGQHVLEARAVDVAGNADPSPATQTVVVPSAQGPGTGPGTGTSTDAGDEVAPVISSAKLRKRRLTYTLSEAAKVRVKIQRKAGRRWRTLRTVTIAGRPGANGKRLAKLPRRGKLRVVLTATDAVGNASAELTVRPR